LHPDKEVEGKGSQRGQKSLTAGGSSSLLLHQEVGDGGNKTDKKRKYVPFSRQSHGELVVRAQVLAKRVKVADQRLFEAKEALAKAQAREKEAHARAKRKTGAEIRLLTAVEEAETKLEKSNCRWPHGTFVNLAEAIAQGKVGPNSIMAQYIANSAKNLSRRRSNSLRFTPDLKRLFSAARLMNGAKAGFGVLRGPGGDGSKSTAPLIEDAHFNLLLPSDAAMDAFDNKDAVDPTFKTGVSEVSMAHIAAETDGPLKIGYDATHCADEAPGYCGNKFAAGDVDFPGCKLDWRDSEKQYTKLYDALDGQDKQGKPLGILGNPSLIKSATKEQQKAFTEASDSLHEFIHARMNSMNENLSNIERSMNAKREEYVTRASNKRKREGQVRLTPFVRPNQTYPCQCGKSPFLVIISPQPHHHHAG
jgi:hypothetical protein